LDFAKVLRASSGFKSLEAAAHLKFQGVCIPDMNAFAEFGFLPASVFSIRYSVSVFL